ncbi:hypothetical protein DEO72_LG6g1396 [Vigna unguiculata]|uniref:Uncharacterized protein n=1 Tax=Vigna unguiculata TaxID=3917 RepID=A0A4D6M854_VIGUN|nr:hypothetical protein DEO72_LG6g1396 [Vigna unguiculata]
MSSDEYLKVEFPIRITFVTSQHYQTRQLNTKEGNLTGPIHTRHNVYTHTGNTRQPKPQLKSSSCSSAIPSHNQEMPFRATTQGIQSEPKLKQHQLPNGAHVPLDATRLWCLCPHRCGLAGRPSPPGATPVQRIVLV